MARLGAALAFYTTVSVAPLLMLAVACAGIVFHNDTARQRVLGQIEQLVGADASRALAAIQPAGGQHRTTIAAWVGFITLAVGGLGVFSQLQNALNVIWRAPKRTGEHWTVVLRRRLFSFGTVIVTGFIMLVSLIVSAGLTWLGDGAHFRNWPVHVWQAANLLTSLAFSTALFAVIFKLLPDVPVEWRNVWSGAAVTACLFEIGKTGLGLYLGHTRLTSSYGAASSIIALLLWCYYAGQILFIGAEFTRVQSVTRSGRLPMPAA